MEKQKIVYLSIPYTWNPEKSFEVANKITAQLMEAGRVVFSPISHGHYVSKNLKKENVLSWDFWIKQDLAMLSVSDEMVLVHLKEKDDKFGEDLIYSSKGCIEEISFCLKNNIKILHYYYE